MLECIKWYRKRKKSGTKYDKGFWGGGIPM